MSPADAKRGAKRRKNKRGGGSSGSASTNSSCSSNNSNSVGTAGALRSPQKTVASVGLLTAANNGNHTVNGGETPFTFGLGQRAPYTTGEHCLLCRSERKDSLISENGTTNSNKIALSTSPKVNSMLHLPLWVCPDCRRTVEKEERQATLEQPVLNQEFLVHMPLGNSSSQQDTTTGGILTTGAQTVPSSNLNTLQTSEVACNCDACSERREISAETERESQQLQNYWSEVRYMVRCIYRQAGTPLADDQDQSLKEGMKELVDRLCERDPYQLYQRLEQQAREYVLEMKVRLLRHLSFGSNLTSGVQGPPQAHQLISLLFEEYSALCQAARTISTFLVTLENEHLKKFHVTWELHNKHLFESLVFSEPLLQASLPTLVEQLRLGTASHDSYSEDMYSTLLQKYHELEQEMSHVSTEWQECQKQIDDYVDEQMALKTKQRLLKEDWELFKQRRVYEEQLNGKKVVPTGENNFTETMRHMLSSRLSMPDCPNCNYRRRCTCDDCSLSHILTCGIMDSPITDDMHISQLPLQVESTTDYLSEIRPPSMSSASSGSGSSSPVTIQQHPRLILTDSGTAPTFGSDDDDGPRLSTKYGDIYSGAHYNDVSVVANMNGIHGELNGGSENMTLKDESPQVSSTSSSSSEVDDDEADGESSGEPPGSPKESTALGKHVGRKDELRKNSPPPSYPSQQIDQVPNACECHVCKQEVSSLTASALAVGRLPTSHQFINAEKPSHPALHLYPHIHGHLPLHTIPHLSRPLIHPSLYTSPPFTHKALPSASLSGHTGKHQVFNASFQDHMYPSCFENTPEWNSSKVLSLWGSDVLNEKNWNPAAFLPEAFAGSDVLSQQLPEVRPEEHHVASSTDTAVIDKEKKNTAKKKCLYNFQDVVMATSSATSSVSCTATTVQSSNNQFNVSTKRPSSLGEVFHSIGKEDHRHPVPVAPRNSPTGIVSLQSFAPSALSPNSAPHITSLGTPPFPKKAATAPGFVDPHSGVCSTTAATLTTTTNTATTTTTDSSVSAPPSVCSDPDCEGHRCENSNTYDHQQYDGEESQDEDSCSENSSSTSTSTNQKEGKYCDCCYCEFFGHGGPPAAPTSRNYAEMREKLRLRLTKRKEEQPKKDDQPVSDRDSVVDNRKVEDLLQFINSSEAKPISTSRAAKRARHKQRKLEEKARQEAEALEREHQRILEMKRREEKERLEQERQRHQEFQKLRVAKKKRRDKVKLGLQNSQLTKEATLGTTENIENDRVHLPENTVQSCWSPSRHCNTQEARPLLESGSVQQTQTNGRDLKQTELQRQEEVKLKQPELLSVLSDAVLFKETNDFRLLKQTDRQGAEQTKKPEVTRATERDSKPESFSIFLEPKNNVAEVTLVAELKEEKKVKDNNKKNLFNHMKEDKAFEISDSHPQCDQSHQQNKLPTAESPQPKGKGKKNKKKKGDKPSSSIDDVFLPRDIDLDNVEMDETEREVEYFKRFCLDSARQNRQRLSINWSNFSLKKATFAAH
ncbi:protein FAM193A isoform X2 [Protopterus annectens]|uniref:protein FAM193A isoform X2 n=1 Tax=Protopterus annectens TaxID=7888 RepID=UPI001CFA7591|nr:protein FAM193A isoform X2 [Protopterus annectens]